MNSETKLESYMKTLHEKLDSFKAVEDQKEDKAKRHRLINTIFMFAVLAIACLAYLKVPEYIEADNYQTEIAQLIQDEGYRAKPYKDTLGNYTVGFGHMVKQGEVFTHITPYDAIELLRKDYFTAKFSVEKKYPWASGDVKLVLVNMTYQMGPSRLSKFELSLSAMQLKDYDRAAAELLNSTWAAQTPARASRLAARILQLNSEWW